MNLCRSKDDGGGEGGLGKGRRGSINLSTLQGLGEERGQKPDSLNSNKIRTVGKTFFFSNFFLFGCTQQYAGLSFPGQGMNLGPLQWKRRGLTTGPWGKSQYLKYF